MGRFFGLLGLLCFLIDMFIFFIGFWGLESDWFAAVVDPLVCVGEESLRAEPGIEDTVNMYCGVGEKSRTVTSQVMMGLFVCLITSSLLCALCIFIGNSLMSRQEAPHYSDMMSPFTVRNDEPANMDIIDAFDAVAAGILPSEFAAVMQTVLDAIELDMDEFLYQPLAQRLQQLQDAHQQGLLTADDYERLRTAIIDKLDD